LTLPELTLVVRVEADIDTTCTDPGGHGRN